MEKIIKVLTQTEFEVALKEKDCEIELLGSGFFTVTSGSPTVVSRGSSSPRVESWESMRCEWQRDTGTKGLAASQHRHEKELGWVKDAKQRVKAGFKISKVKAGCSGATV